MEPASVPRSVLHTLAGCAALLAAGTVTSLYSADAAVYMKTAALVLAAAIAVVRAVTAEHERIVWIAFAAGLTLWTAGDLLFIGTDQPELSAADVLYLAAYPFFAAGVMLLVRVRIPHIEWELWLDGVICALTVSAAGAAIAYRALSGGNAEDTSVIVNLAYPLADLALVAVAVACAGAYGWRPDRTFLMLGVGFMLLAVVDTIYLVRSSGGMYHDGNLADSGWAAAMLLIAASTWQPAGRTDSRLAAQSMVIPSAATIGAIVLLVLSNVIALNALSITLACAALLVVLARLVLTFRQKEAALSASRHQAVTDPLTGLGNRRLLTEHLQATLDQRRQAAFVVFDLDGFKSYNDTYGHPAGDELLQRLGGRLGDAVKDHGQAYRLGGDEFCVILRESSRDRIRDAAEALHDSGPGFDIRASWGVVALCRDTDMSVGALSLADKRMYAHKRSSRTPVKEQVREALLAALHARRPDLDDHTTEVSSLARKVAEHMRLNPEHVAAVADAADLHDIGKIAIPDTILDRPTALDENEWRFVRQHTVIGERILRAAPAMTQVARYVRSSHEHWDGGGYPDRLAGETIPLGARIIAVTDAYDAITSARPYDPARSSEDALAELRRCSGTQFDPQVVEAFEEIIRSHDQQHGT